MENKNIWKVRLTKYLVYFITINYSILAIITIVISPEKASGILDFIKNELSLIVGIIIGKYFLRSTP